VLRFVAAAFALLSVTFASGSPDDDSGREPFERAVVPFVSRYCVTCHNERSNSGGLDLTVFKDFTAFRNNRDAWERILKRVAAGEMPPRRGPQPPAADTEAVIVWLRAELGKTESESKIRFFPLNFLPI
jgi:hypothetical protein